MHSNTSLRTYGNPLNMIYLLVTRPLTWSLSFATGLNGVEFYGSTVIIGILRCLCKNGLVKLKDFHGLSARVRRLTAVWDAKELEDLTRAAQKRAVPFVPELLQAQIGSLRRPHEIRDYEEKGKIHKWFRKLKPGWLMKHKKSSSIWVVAERLTIEWYNLHRAPYIGTNIPHEFWNLFGTVYQLIWSNERRRAQRENL